MLELVRTNDLAAARRPVTAPGLQADWADDLEHFRFVAEPGRSTAMLKFAGVGSVERAGIFVGIEVLESGNRSFQ